MIYKLKHILKYININYKNDKTWSDGYINDMAGVVNYISYRVYDLMEWQSCIDNQESCQTICRLELKRFSDAIQNISSN